MVERHPRWDRTDVLPEHDAMYSIRTNSATELHDAITTVIDSPGELPAAEGVNNHAVKNPIFDGSRHQRVTTRKSVTCET